jgi:hypothetical protein
MKKEIKVEITELFMAKAGLGNKGFDRCFHGTIRRERDAEGNPVVYGKIKVNDGYIYAKAENQWILGDKLDQMIIMILDNGLHQDSGKTSTIAETPFFFS